jgi:hypothetical protein
MTSKRRDSDKMESVGTPHPYKSDHVNVGSSKSRALDKGQSGSEFRIWGGGGPDQVLKKLFIIDFEIGSNNSETASEPLLRMLRPFCIISVPRTHMHEKTIFASSAYQLNCAGLPSVTTTPCVEKPKVTEKGDTSKVAECSKKGCKMCWVRSINSYKFNLHLTNKLQFHRECTNSLQKTGPATCVVPQNGVELDFDCNYILCCV